MIEVTTVETVLRRPKEGAKHEFLNRSLPPLLALRRRLPEAALLERKVPSSSLITWISNATVTHRSPTTWRNVPS